MATFSLSALLLILLGSFGCAPGESDVLNDDGSRGPVGAEPETTIVSDVTADRSYQATLTTGDSPVLLVSKEGKTESIAYLRIDLVNLPDTSDVTGAIVGLRFRKLSWSDGVVLAAHLVRDGEREWREESLRLPGRELEAIPFFTSPAPIEPAEGETLFVSRAIEIPSAIVRKWELEGSSNLGMAIRVQGGDGGIEILSKEAFVPDSVGVAQLNPRVEVERADRDSVLETTADDAYVLNEVFPLPTGTDSLLVVRGRPAIRALVRFDFAGSVLRRGDTINRAILRLAVDQRSVSAGESLSLSAFHAESDWEEAAPPDSVTRRTSALSAAPIGSSTGTVEFDVASAVQSWIDGGANYGIQVRMTAEARDTLGVDLLSREAAASRRPSLFVVYSRPPEPRWTGGTAP